MSTKIKNGLSYQKNGWKYVSIKGKPKERGYAYGYLCADDFKEIQKTLIFLMLVKIYEQRLPKLHEPVLVL